ncbi:glycogen/starch/alpha-glucan phosphorylase [Geotalea uraniireducens]|uniref:Alpha-1,4 glucan phosphorylase n=1 Tax=Geotalea uraniireducens (strain Rf4) TaxID=351605 RepID=A5G4W8_GEOUR|nr:glycogen/starch/alpha-glucan phosphorylase [Geotalea uraniireducens]ABQ26836.1 glycogen/starch/alpha-glucan phosphorylase [Geotalea uraniireducens Rf4]
MDTKLPKQKSVAAVPSPADEGREEFRRGSAVDALTRAILDHLYFTQARPLTLATRNDWYMALAYAVRDRMLDDWLKSLSHLRNRELKIVSYLSAEFLMGPHLGNNLVNLGIMEPAREALAALGQDLDELLRQEEEPGLGNGGLGRLAACYLDSLATLRVPAIGYGIRYEFGIFDQEIRDGWQAEKTDKWLRLGNPWEICRPEITYEVKVGGHTERFTDEKGCVRVRWVPNKVVKGVAYDTPVAGYRSGVTDLLRLWKSEAVESFDFQAFNVGDYYRAVEAKIFSETISKVLYPNDEPEIGKALRLGQQYFFVSCSLQDMVRIHLLRENSLDTFAASFAVQLNDTHPSIAVAELMRLLVDEHQFEWDAAWQITRATLAYTNHTLLPEALEKWPLPLFASILPRHLEIIYEINRRFLDEVRLVHQGDDQLAARLSIIDENGERYVRMAHLASVGSHAINGVAALHTELLKQTVLKDFYEIHPELFRNVTNGVTPRRWMVLSNPGLTRLITERIGDGWVTNPDELRGLEPFVADQTFQSAWQKVKRENKSVLAGVIKARTGIVVDPASLFDVLVKRIHEYKRQHLKVLHIITLYNRIKHDPQADVTPRTFIFGGKAAPGYFMAKLIIKLVNSMGEVVNSDPDVADRLKVVFFPDFNVTNGQMVYPAADLSEQISTAGKEASGTGNMKFSLNGALTIGTLDGANVEIREEVGAENFFLFGLTAAEVSDLKSGGYDPRKWYGEKTELREAIDQIAGGLFSHGDRGLFQPLVEHLLNRDDYLLLADYQAYIDCQDRVSAAFRDRKRWTEMSILNVARMGKFSSDRAIREYCSDIWQASPLPQD